ncbi:MAG TPA: carotenoid oxygenase [Cyanobacteria bacterium UBA11149]|nr:carotenoid oxygenase [Cyanobacteria bacterium UBA11367]HBE58040.1 carotenoid oxygenase [Cyanobacteria bacterium UBA11366]HBK66255.1 carotenoid oxygenase [Cyanobacteria bacterium UBA11166]HBR75341.1 carotenoid oxygenase [Cyanobacteria bacterium UBA11159]HBS71944.1 carotenoid oxygenase [Cyanobacteria bacterium UBA11153]HBW90536.1 carotenoid oxygenase [Cyanobacteria bacterium UBA11149]HCA93925.1 carotenoid oxygenase [Cyanobacteria bacterium UBA9226]
MSIKIILFDFDGTIADTFDALVNIANGLAGEFGFKPLTPEEIPIVKTLTARQLIEKSGISIFKIPPLLQRVKSDLRQYIETLSPIIGIKESLQQLKNDGNILGILTTNSQENVRLFLHQHKMEYLFSHLYSESTIFGKNKILKKFLSQHNWIPEEVIYVGDEARDIESSRKAHIKVIAVTWGFNAPEVLAKHNPDFLIHHPRELIEIIRQI